MNKNQEKTLKDFLFYDFVIEIILILSTYILYRFRPLMSEGEAIFFGVILVLSLLTHVFLVVGRLSWGAELDG